MIKMGAHYWVVGNCHHRHLFPIFVGWMFTYLVMFLLSPIYLYHFASDGLLYSLGGYDGNSYLNTVECYNSQTKQWSHVAPMHYSRSCFATAVCDGYLYALGGYGPSYLRTVERYDPSTNSWEMMPAMSTYRINFGGDVLNGCLYVVGKLQSVLICTLLICFHH